MAISFVLADHDSSTGGVTLESAGWETGGGSVLIIVKSNVPLGPTAMASQGFDRIIGVEAEGYNLATSVFAKHDIPAGGEVYTIPDAGDHTTAAIVEFQSTIGALMAIGAVLAPTTPSSVGPNDGYYWSNGFSSTQPNAQLLLGLTHNVDTTSSTLFNTPIQGGLSGAPTIAVNQSYNTGTGGGIFMMFGSKSSPGALGTSTGVGSATGTPGDWNALPFYIELYEIPPPVITSASTVENLVNTTLAHTITATKTIASTAIIGGTDAALFEINGTAQLRFVGNGLSAALGNRQVQVRVTDTDGMTVDQTITVPVKAIIFKGIKVYSRAGATTTATSSLTDFANPLTGATGIPAAIGDTVIVIPAIGSNADRDMIITSGYTELADHYVNGTTYDANIGAFLKQLSAADTTVTFGSSGSANDAQGGVLLLFRGVDPTTPLDVALVPGGGTGTGKPNPEPITPVTVGAVGVFGGAQAAATAVNLTSSDLTAFRQVIQADTNDIAVGAGFIEWSGSGAIDPAVFGGGSSVAANSWASVSFALRPAWVATGTDYRYKGANWAARYLGAAAENVRYQGAKTLHP